MFKCNINIVNAVLKDAKSIIEKMDGKILYEASLNTFSILVIEFPKEESCWDIIAEKWKLEDELKRKLNLYL